MDKRQCIQILAWYSYSGVQYAQGLACQPNIAARSSIIDISVTTQWQGRHSHVVTASYSSVVLRTST